jgi:hypothetical protein
MPERDMDEPVNVDLDPEDALRVLLGEEKRETEDEDAETEDTTAEDKDE